jgi:hypothetical protein
MPLHKVFNNLLIVLVQIANKIGLEKRLDLNMCPSDEAAILQTYVLRSIFIAMANPILLQTQNQKRQPPLRTEDQ